MMDGISIHDTTDHLLSFDMPELLLALGPEAAEAFWRPKTHITYVSVDDQSIPALDWNLDRTPWTRGRTLLQLTELRQVIDGVLESVQASTAAAAAEQVPWVVLRAVDSSWWEVYSEDPEALGALKRAFRDVRPARYTPDHPATDY